MWQPPHDTGVIILAAGKGTRLGCTDIPKAMVPIHAKPMVVYIIETLESMGFLPEQIVVVVGFQKQKVKEYLGDRVTYIDQDEQLGTGHAVAMTEPYVRGRFSNVLVLYADMPRISSGSVIKLIERHLQKDTPVTMGTATTPNFDGRHKPFMMFGRIIRNDQGVFEKIVEWADATEEQTAITELSTCIFCFDVRWLFTHVSKLETQNKQSEYYLVDLPEKAANAGGVATAELPLSDVYGVNTKEDLAALSSFIK